tara:strand:- start:526 stop:741 length:216 start_codon:yes stop_codon:yes gene_type:complete
MTAEDKRRIDLRDLPESAMADLKSAPISEAPVEDADVKGGIRYGIRTGKTGGIAAPGSAKRLTPAGGDSGI